MFEDKNQQKEPEDIFAGAENQNSQTPPNNLPSKPPQQPSAPQVNQQPPASQPPIGTPSRVPTPQNQRPVGDAVRPPAQVPADQVAIEQPKKSWGKLLLIVVVIVIILGVGAWLALRYSVFSPKTIEEAPEIGAEKTTELPEVPVVPEVKPPVDSDNDGLTDEEELLLGTDALLPDSDADGLSDRDEVKVYKTDPLDSDTDKDGFFDGEEVKNGYDPKGSGRLFEVPVPGEE